MAERKPTRRETRLKKELAEALRKLGEAQKRAQDLERDNAFLRRQLEQERESVPMPPPYPETPLPWAPVKPWRPTPTYPPGKPFFANPNITITCNSDLPPVDRPLSARGRYY